MRTPRDNFFSSSDLLRLNPIPQPITKEAKRRAKLTPKRRAEILDRKTIQAHDLTIHLEYQVRIMKRRKTKNKGIEGSENL